MSLNLIFQPNFVRRQDPFIWIGSAIAFTLPFSIQVNSFFIILFFLYAVFQRIREKDDLESRIWFSPLLLLIIFFLLYTAGVAWSGDKHAGISQLGKTVSFLIIPLSFLIRARKISGDEIAIICFSFIIGCFVTSIICYANAAYNVIHFNSFKALNTERDYYYFNYIHLTKPMHMDPIYLSMYCNFSVFFLLTTDRIKNNKWKIFLIAYLIVYILLISSKIGIICLLFAILIFPFVKNGIKLKFVIAAFVALLLTAISVEKIAFLRDRFLVGLEFNYKDEHVSLWNSTSQRLAIWSCVGEAVAKEPFISGYGTGYGNRILQNIYREKEYVRGYQDELNAHNEFFQTTLDIGIPGLILLVCVLASPLLSGRKENKIILLLFISMMMEYFLVESVFSRQRGIVFFAFFYCLLTYTTSKKL